MELIRPSGAALKCKWIRPHETLEQLREWWAPSLWGQSMAKQTQSIGLSVATLAVHLSGLQESSAMDRLSSDVSFTNCFIISISGWNILWKMDLTCRCKHMAANIQCSGHWVDGSCCVYRIHEHSETIEMACVHSLSTTEVKNWQLVIPEGHYSSWENSSGLLLTRCLFSWESLLESKVNCIARVLLHACDTQLLRTPLHLCCCFHFLAMLLYNLCYLTKKING